MKRADIGLIGIAVMGKNLARNMLSKGFSVAVYDLAPEKTVKEFLDSDNNDNLVGTYSLEELVEALERPRRIMMMVRAGQPVDDYIEKLLPLLDDGDIIIDGGNSNYEDTVRRVKRVEENGKLFVGMGVSGGEEGALKGPSLMPGGSAAAWPHIKSIMQTICAKVDGEPCCDWVGEGGAGHFVKMVHNGIEYGDMQLICEAYQLMRDVLCLDNDEMHRVFENWNKTELDSYLIEITGEILSHREKNGDYLVDNILDVAGQKGTGKWTGIAALEEGVPLTLIGEAVFARCLSAMKEEREAASRAFKNDQNVFAGSKENFTEDIRRALYASKIISYAQGYSLMRVAAEKYGWNLNYGGIAAMWRGGCIIRSVFLGNIKTAFDNNADLRNLILDPFFKGEMEKCVPSWRNVVAEAARRGVPIPAMSSALNYFDGYRCGRLPANLLQAQRDYFGAHTFERVDRPRGEFFHENWTGHGGDTSAASYNV